MEIPLAFGSEIFGPTPFSIMARTCTHHDRAVAYTIGNLQLGGTKYCLNQVAILAGLPQSLFVTTVPSTRHGVPVKEKFQLGRYQSNGCCAVIWSYAILHANNEIQQSVFYLEFGFKALTSKLLKKASLDSRLGKE